MKKTIIALILLSGSVLFAAENPRLISVSGFEEKTYEPDMAYIRVSAWGKSENASAAKEASNKQHELIKKVIQKYGIKKEDVQTESFDLTPEYTYDKITGNNKMTGHMANHTLRVTIRKIDQLGKFVDDIIVKQKNINEGTRIDNISWDVDKREEYQSNMMTQAVKNAEKTARVLATAANVKVKQLFHLVPQDNYLPVPQMPKMMMDALAEEKAAAPTTFTPGEVKIRATVSADYEIE